LEQSLLAPGFIRAWHRKSPVLYNLLARFARSSNAIEKELDKLNKEYG